jgi:hypothetical protein
MHEISIAVKKLRIALTCQVGEGCMADELLSVSDKS